MMKRLLLIFAAALAGGALADANVTQTLTFATNGYHCAYVEATPANNACEAVFGACTNVKTVLCYDARAYAQTAQYDSEGKRIYQKPVAFKVWRRDATPGNPATLHNVIGGMIYVIEVDGLGPGEVRTLELKGRPQLPHLYWCELPKAGETNGLLNLVAPSLPEDADKVRVVDYFGEGPAGSLPSTYEVLPNYEGGAFDSRGALVLKPRAVYAMSAQHESDWSGVIGVVGADDGISFSSNGSAQVSFALQNRGTTNHTFRLTYGAGADGETPPAVLFMKSGSWTSLAAAAGHDITVAPSEQAYVTLAADPLTRKQGEGLLTISDLGASKMRVRLPVVVEEASGPKDGLWPNGLFMGSFRLNKVSFGTDQTPRTAGGTVEGSLIYLSDNGGARGRLLQRLCLGIGTNDTEFLFQDLVKARAAAKADTSVRRVSSVLLDPYQPQVEGAVNGGTGTFRWTVGKHAATNPMRHSWHPDHDGLRSLSNGSVTLAPDGDDLSNYSESIKPELFSIANVVTLTGLPGPSNDVSQVIGESVSGTITWRLSGLRSAAGGGDIVCEGRYSLTRVSQTTKLED